MKRLFGSLFNRLDENRKPPTPEIGMGATILMYSDRVAVTVVEILSPKRILIQEDYANRTDKNGMSESQEYEYRPNPNAAEREFSLRKDGRWKEAKGATVLMLGERDHYYDYSF
ncbi:MAG: hypothetical protein ACHQU0_03220 [Candidatus Paceibacteria bacterium]